MNIIGISAFYHESMCCLIQDGTLRAAAAEERFTRVKFDRRVPINAFRYCLREGGGLHPGEIDAIAYYEHPQAKLARQLSMGLTAEHDPTFQWLDPRYPERSIRQNLGFGGRFLTYPHHLSHAASSFFFSGFRDAAILTVDGVGEWATTSYGRGSGDKVELFDEVRYPASLGLLYSTITEFLGFRVLSDEYKVMGLAPYGTTTMVPKLRQLIQRGEGGQYALDMRFFDFSQPDRMYTDALASWLGIPPRVPESELTATHCDLARSLQFVLEETLLDLVHYLHQQVPVANLCLAGGVALNCVAMARVRRESPFEDIFVQPAAGDAGSALGAAALAHIELTGRRHTHSRLPHVYLGPRYANDHTSRLLRDAGIDALDFRDQEDALLDAVVDRLCAQKVVAWFHGRSEYGPRALGGRSILGDPRNPEMRDRLNNLVKKRESFRPFAPSVLAEHLAAHMDLAHPSPFMTETCQVTSQLDLPAITHVDGSARVQTVAPEHNPRYARLLQRFYERTGCPMLVNTSFNVRGEPMVLTPEDALRCMARTQIDCLVLEDHLIDRAMIPRVLRHGMPAAAPPTPPPGIHPRLTGQPERWVPADPALPDGVYTFV